MALVTAGIPLLGHSDALQDEWNQGLEMVKKANADIVDSKRLYRAAQHSAHLAEQERKVAANKLAEASRLKGEGYLLMRDADKLAAEDFRSRALALDLRVKNEEAEVSRLKAAIENDRRTSSDYTQAAAKLRDSLKNETDPARKSELTKMTETLTQEASEAGAEIANLERRIAAGNEEIARQTKGISHLNELADKLDPVPK